MDTSTREFSYHSYYGAEGADGPVHRRIAELAAIVASDCDPPLETSYVRELLQALVNSIRGRAAEGWTPTPRTSAPPPSPEAPRASETRPRTGLTPDLEFEPSCPEAAPGSAQGRRLGAEVARAVACDDAQSVLQELRNERARGEGPHEDLQRALG